MTTLKEVRARFARDQGLPFAHTLSEHCILETLDEHAVKYRNRLFSPVTTIWGFLELFVPVTHLQLYLIFPLFWFLVGVSGWLLRMRYR